jgi:hypothetical protein
VTVPAVAAPGVIFSLPYTLASYGLISLLAMALTTVAPSRWP